MAEIDENFENTDAGSSLTYPDTAGNIKKGGLICLKESFPCKVMEISHSKPGKHGAAKINMIGIDIFTGKKYEETFGAGSNVQIPNMVKKEWQLIDINNDNYCTLMLEDGTTKEDIKLEDKSEDDQELAKKIKEDFEAGKEILVTVLTAMGKEKIILHREVATN